MRPQLFKTNFTMHMLSIIIKGFSELADPASRRVLWMSIGLSLTALVLIIAALQMLLTYMPPLGSWMGLDWIDSVLHILVGAGSMVLAWFLFPGIAIAAMGLFLDGVCRRIERRDYPDHVPGQDLSFTTAAMDAARFALRALLVNLALLVVMVVLPLLYPVLYFIANGYLIVREVFFQVGLRHIPAPAVRALFQHHRISLIFLGCLLTGLLLVPVLNLCTPLITLALIIHKFKSIHQNAVRLYNGAT